MLPYLSYIFISTGIVLIYLFLNAKGNPPIFGIYQQKDNTYWFKFWMMYIIIKLRQLRMSIKQRSDGDTHVRDHFVNIEKLYDLGDFPKVVDGVYFNGMSQSGEALVCGIARRAQNACDAFLILKINGEDVLLTPSLPDTFLKKSNEDGIGHDVQGLTVSNFVPMRTWKLTYNGEMKPRNDPNKLVKVETNLTWGAHFHPFEYERQMSASSMASDMAKESWSGDYFKLLKKFHQTHYEQVGSITGTVSVDGTKYEIDMPCLRDRSFGPIREWRNFHRYTYHFIFLENGDFIAVGSVSQLTILSHLTIGYYARKSDQSLTAIDYSDYQLYQHGENQILPSDYAFSFQAGGVTYVVKVQSKDEVSFYIGKDREAKLYEKWCEIEVNNMKGRACVEWQYNNVIPK